VMRQQEWQQNDRNGKNGDKGQWGTMGALGRTWGMYIDKGNAMKQAVRIVGAPRNAAKRVCFWRQWVLGRMLGMVGAPAKTFGNSVVHSRRWTPTS
jgi:hypothetical protein